MIVVVEPAGRTPCFFVCFVSWLEIMRANRAVKGACGPGFQLSADAACQPVALEELWLQLNKRGVRDADRRIWAMASVLPPVSVASSWDFLRFHTWFFAKSVLGWARDAGIGCKSPYMPSPPPPSATDLAVVTSAAPGDPRRRTTCQRIVRGMVIFAVTTCHALITRNELGLSKGKSLSYVDSLGALVTLQPFMSKTPCFTFFVPASFAPCRCARFAGTDQQLLVSYKLWASKEKLVRSLSKSASWGAGKVVFVEITKTESTFWLNAVPALTKVQSSRRDAALQSGAQRTTRSSTLSSAMPGWKALLRL